MPQSKPDYQAIAKENDVNLDEVKPLSAEARIAILESILALEDVPYPIPVSKRQPYLDAAKSGELFSIGNFSDETVDLVEYKNQQDYSQYSYEEHLSWACLVSQQQKTKHEFACREYLSLIHI